MMSTEKVYVLNPIFEQKESVLVLSKDSDSIGVLLRRTDLSRREPLEAAVWSYANTASPVQWVPEVGDYVLSLSELSEPMWCRALVLEASSSSALVEQVDYGYRETVAISNVIELPAAFATEPAFSSRLKVDASQFVVAGSYEVLIGDFVDGFQRTVEATLVTDLNNLPTSNLEEAAAAAASAEEAEAAAAEEAEAAAAAAEADNFVIPEDLNDTEEGIVNGFTSLEVDGDTVTIYGVQHRDGFEHMSQQLAQVNFQLKYEVRKGDYVVVPFDTIFCRALVTDIGADSATVYHVDFGSWDTVSSAELFSLEAGAVSDTPQMSFQCIVSDQEHLDHGQKHKLRLVSARRPDDSYPVYVCDKVPPNVGVGVGGDGGDGDGGRVVLKVADLPPHSLLPAELVQLVETHSLNGERYGALVLERLSTFSDVEPQLEQAFLSSTADLRNGPEIGELVISYVDGIFYRSVVCDASADSFLVFLVDAGSFRYCDASVIVALPESLVVQPPAALLWAFGGAEHCGVEMTTTFKASNFMRCGSLYGMAAYTLEIAGSDDVSPNLECTNNTESEIAPFESREPLDPAYVPPSSPLPPSPPPPQARSRSRSRSSLHVDAEESPNPATLGYYASAESTFDGDGAPKTQLAGESDTASVPSNGDIGYLSGPGETNSSMTTEFEAALRTRMQHRTFPEHRFDEASSSYADAKVVNASSRDGFVTLSLALVDRQELIEECLATLDPATLKNLYLSSLPSKTPGLTKSGDTWVRVVVLERPSPSSYTVQLVDYGFQTTCSVVDVFCCPAEFVSFEMCAVECDFWSTVLSLEKAQSLVGEMVVVGNSPSSPFGIFSRESGESLITL